MKRGAVGLDPELESLLRFRTVARRLPDDVRARVLARSRAFVWGERAVAAVAPFEDPRSPAATTSQRAGLGRLALAASIALVVGAAGAVAALRNRAADVPPPAPPERPVSSPASMGGEAVPDVAKAAPTIAAHHTMTSKPHPTPKARGADPLAEVELLQHAHVAYARRDFSSALALVAEHARRFPGGPLAEECEALRVESLLASGHAVEAKRASAAFAARFPRSVLLPRIEQAAHDPE